MPTDSTGRTSFYDITAGAVQLGGQGGHMPNQFFRKEKGQEFMKFRSLHILHNSIKVEVLPTQFLQDCTAPDN